MSEKEEGWKRDRRPWAGKINVLYTHPASFEEKQVKEDCRKLQQILDAKFRDQFGVHRSPLVVVTSGRKEHRTSFQGNWEEWQRSIVFRMNSVTQKPRFSLFVVPGRFCGRATAGIVGLALMENRPVLSWDQDEDTFSPVACVASHDPEDWQTGFAIRLRERLPPEDGHHA